MNILDGNFKFNKLALHAIMMSLDTNIITDNIDLSLCRTQFEIAKSYNYLIHKFLIKKN
jgi:hypothetical protein